MSGSVPGPKGFTPCLEKYSTASDLIPCDLPAGHPGHHKNEARDCRWVDWPPKETP